MTRYTASGVLRALILATMVAGTLDILAAFLFAGTAPANVLRAVASGVIGTAGANSHIGAAVGLLLHFTLMAVFANLYLIAVMRAPALNHTPVLSGIAFGLLVWILMYHFVLPIRWPGLYPINTQREVARQLLAHVAFVGIPIALIVRSASNWGRKIVANDPQ
ncbi:hypothetical protein [Sphingomonas immobilis]|uniref:DUF1440 domain-containing protein n=1 Tax=Sphingomonas immobilis TaxID=3063997 RepID=A0ABT8ZYS1_9SPHN|nr:hypothetical protein [Sphingomonas sp. CA1-15]MDO7842433.1 hypothetical protein [Sphingomonas sp. CA1-15]